jgi:hypothetical protein
MVGAAAIIAGRGSHIEPLTRLLQRIDRAYIANDRAFFAVYPLAPMTKPETSPSFAGHGTPPGKKCAFSDNPCVVLLRI